MTTKLTSKEERFVQALVLTQCKQWEAAQIAGYSGTGRALVKMGSLVANRPRVKNALAELVKGQGIAGCMSREEVLARLTEQARAAYCVYIRPDGSTDLERMAADGKMHLIKRIRPTPSGEVVEFYDAQKALELLGRYYDLFPDKVQVDRGPTTVRVVYEEPYDLTLEVERGGER